MKQGGILNFTGGKREVFYEGRFVVARYTGKFENVELQAMADTGCWYAWATGTGERLKGEGDTAAGAVADLKARARLKIEEITRIYLGDNA